MSRYIADGHGGTCRSVIDLSNTARNRPRRLTNAEVFERVALFLRTGDKRHLPPALRPEAEGILAMAVESARSILRDGMPPWPGSAAGQDPGPGAPVGEMLRALTGPRADEDSGFGE